MTDFIARHLGPNQQETNEMLGRIGCSSLSELIDKTIPSDIRLQQELNIAPGITEAEYLQHIS
jgi:glycine dehydrogenase